MNLSRGIALTLCTCTSLLLFTGCNFDSPNKKAVSQFLDAYKNQDFQAMSQYTTDASLTEVPYVIADLPQDLITQYKHIFTNFSYAIEREEKLDDSTNVYVSITYNDCGSPSEAAFNDYLAELENATLMEAPEAVLSEKLSHSLGTNLKTVTETFIVPVKKNPTGTFELTLTEPLKNALTANINVFTSAIEAYSESQIN